MAPNDASINIHIQRTDECLRIHPQGDINLQSSPALRQTLKSALSEGQEPVDIVLADVEYMDSSGVATLVEALQQCRQHGRTLRLLAPTPRVHSIFQIAKLDSIFTIVTDPEGHDT